MIDVIFLRCRFAFLNCLQLHFEWPCLLEVLGLMMFLHIPVVLCVELDDVSLILFLCFSERL